MSKSERIKKLAAEGTIKILGFDPAKQDADFTAFTTIVMDDVASAYQVPADLIEDSPEQVRQSRYQKYWDDLMDEKWHRRPIHDFYQTHQRTKQESTITIEKLREIQDELMYPPNNRKTTDVVCEKIQDGSEVIWIPVVS